MSLAGAIDIGNSTTEILIADVGGGVAEPFWEARTPTRGRKGGDDSLLAAAELLARGERETGRRCDEVAVTRLRPVESRTVAASVASSDSGAAAAIRAAAAQTTGGRGVGSGELARLEELPSAPRGRPLVVYVPAGVDFEEAAREIQAAIDGGLTVVAVLAAGDDAVLIHNRIEVTIPIVDEVELGELPVGSRIVVEVAEPGRKLTTLGDPVALTAALGLPASASAALKEPARAYVDRAAGAIAAPPGGEEAKPQSWVPWLEAAGLGRIPLGPEAARRLAELPLGAASAICLEQGSPPLAVSDAFLVDLGGLDNGGWVRRGLVRGDRMPLAALRADEEEDPAQRLEALIGRPVSLVAEEPRAARLGALSTPAASPDAHVLDIGGGTIDVAGRTRLTAAGAGEMLTVAVAAALGVPPAVAEQVKRGPLVRVVGPQLIHLEDGERRYLEGVASPQSIGRLARLVDGKVAAVELPLAPEEWRGLRLALKETTLGGNVERLLGALEEPPGEILTAGGAAEDEELVQILGERLRSRRIVVGRANVAGRFGPRHAVSYGLLLMLAGKEKHVGAHP